MSAEVIQYRVYLVLAVISACIIAPTAAVVWKRVRRTVFEPLAWCLVAIMWTLTANVFEILSPSFHSTLIWSLVGYAGLVAVPPAGFLFALGYTGRARQNFLAKILPFVVPVITILLLYTNELHHLHWTSVGYRRIGPFSALVLRYGPWFWVFIAHQYALMIAAAAITALDFFAARRSYSLQAKCVVFGAVAPLLFNVLYVFRLLPGVTKDFTPVAFALAGLAFAVGIWRFHLFDLMPVAYRAAFDAMADAVFIVDGGGRLVDANAAAAKLFNLDSDSLGAATSRIPAISAAISSTAGVDEDLEHTPSEFSFDGPGGTRWFEASARRLGAGRGLRVLYALRDVTERRAMFMEKSELVNRLTAALNEINVLRGIVPICAKCKKMRDDEGYWHQVESYFAARSELRFTHGLCPECEAQVMAELDRMDTYEENSL